MLLLAMREGFEEMLKGGHPNSPGRSVEVVDMVLAEPDRFDEPFNGYRSDDEVVRLRPHLLRLSADQRKSVASRAAKSLKALC